MSGRDGNFKLVRDGLPETLFVPSSERSGTGSGDGPWKCSRPKEQQVQRPQAETMPDLKKTEQVGFGTGDMSPLTSC